MKKIFSTISNFYQRKLHLKDDCFFSLEPNEPASLTKLNAHLLTKIKHPVRNILQKRYLIIYWGYDIDYYYYPVMAPFYG